MNKFNIHLSKKNFWFMAIFGAMILFFIVAGILPVYLKSFYLARENDKLKFQIEEQKQLAPVYASILKDLKEKEQLVLPHAGKTALSRGETAKFKDDFRGLAEKSRMRIVSFTSDLNTQGPSSTSLRHNVVLKGEFADFRKLLAGLGGISYLDKIEQVGVQQNTDAMDFKMTIWIAIK